MGFIVRESRPGSAKVSVGTREISGVAKASNNALSIVDIDLF